MIKRLLVVLLAAVAVLLAAPAHADVYPDMPPGVQGPFPVTKVVDGDTIWVDDGDTRVKVREIGLDTPEVVDPRKPVQCFGRDASARAHAVLDGKSVYLETDPSQDRVDKYGRTLAYVWVDGRDLFNVDMIANGYAHEYTYDLPYKYQAEFKAAERDARAQGRGLWSPGACP